MVVGPRKTPTHTPNKQTKVRQVLVFCSVKIKANRLKGTAERIQGQQKETLESSNL